MTGRYATAETAGFRKLGKVPAGSAQGCGIHNHFSQVLEKAPDFSGAFLKQV